MWAMAPISCETAARASLCCITCRWCLSNAFACGPLLGRGDGLRRAFRLFGRLFDIGGGSSGGRGPFCTAFFSRLSRASFVCVEALLLLGRLVPCCCCFPGSSGVPGWLLHGAPMADSTGRPLINPNRGPTGRHPEQHTLRLRGRLGQGQLGIHWAGAALSP